MTPEQEHAVKIARSLAEAGVPIFLARPDAEEPCGYRLPRGWQRTAADPAALDSWVPGMAVCAVMGHVVDGVDIDPRHGGEETRSGLQAAGAWPKSYGRQETPSGGTHDLVAPLGVGSRDGIRPGLDVKGGAADGSGRGFLFLAPTERVSKVTGEVVAYRWTVEPDLAPLLDGDDDDTGLSLAEMVEAAKRRPEPAAPDPFNAPAEVAAKHLGPVRDGERHAALVSFAGYLRDHGLPLAVAEKAMLARLADCEQPPVARTPVTEAEAVQKLRDVYARYAAGAAPSSPDSTATEAGRRTVAFTRASAIKPRPVHWLWSGRIALGSLALLAGREGIGKSTIGYDLAAQVTRGDLPGVYAGEPRQVIVAATEDSWEHTIVPRLMAARADLDRVLRIDVTTSEGVETSLSLPRDLHGLESLIEAERVALVLLDPLMSRLDSNLDTHKDSEVRLALEPLTKIADRTGAAFLGLIHVNKSGGTDPLTGIMGSRAFAAVARAVLYAMTDSDDESLRHLGQPKNNLGSTDLPTMTYRIESAKVADTDEGPVFTGRVNWLGESDQSIRDLLESATETAESRTSVGEAKTWLVEYLTSVGGTSVSAMVKEEGKRAGHSASALSRARQKAKVVSTTVPNTFPRQTTWSLPTPASTVAFDPSEVPPL